MRLKQVGLFYLGEMINVFRRGTILSNQPDQSAQPIYTNPVLFGTSDGGLGVIVQLPDNIFAFLQELQKRVTSSTHNCMRVEHSAYRAFSRKNGWSRAGIY
uniref:DNA damage-binding protein 1 n=1 Tax=Ditylenchus dipsaci TaxID=166011 RepID=A0A915DDQ8_9BILA